MKFNKNLFTLLSVAFLYSATISPALANPISIINRSKAMADLKKDLLATYESSYATVEMLLNAGMKDYDTLCKVPDNSINDGMLQDLKKDYYPSFSTILMLYEANKKSYDNLNK